MVDDPDQLLTRMGYGYVVMLSFSSLLGQICGKSFVPVANIFSGIEKGISKVFGASLFHTGMVGFVFTGLIG